MFFASASRPLPFRLAPLLTSLLIYFYLLLAATTEVVSAMEHIVGDAAGWVVGPNYTRWAVGRRFYVGDTIVFRYQRGDHNVIAVDQGHYRNCTYPSGADTLVSGNDVVRLDEAGAQWYICGIPLHCQTDQRLAVTVLMAPIPTPSPSPSPQTTNPRSGSANAAICSKRSWSTFLSSQLLLIPYTLF